MAGFAAGLVAEVRIAARGLTRAPAILVPAVLTLTLGLGTVLAISGLAESVLLHRLPYGDADRLVVLWRQTEYLERSSLSYPNYLDWKTRNRVFSDFSMLIGDNATWIGPSGEAERVTTVLVSHDLPSTLRLEPAAGRTFAAEDDQPGAEPVALCTWGFWQNRLGGSTDALGGLLTLDEKSYRLIGVLPPGLAGESLGGAEVGDLWLPVSGFFDQLPVHERANRIGIVPVARLAAGVQLEAARADMTRVARELEAEYELSNRGNLARLAPVLEDQVAPVRLALLLLLGSAALVLLIATANLLALLAVRHLGRASALATRRALGASRWALRRVALAESAVVVLLGSVGGLALGGGALALIPAFAVGVPFVSGSRLGPRSLIAIVAVALLLTFLLGLLAPRLAGGLGRARLAIGRSRGASSDRRQLRTRRSLVALQFALSLALLVAALLSVRTLENLRNESLGLRTEGVMTALVAPPVSSYGDDVAWTALYDRILGELERAPGVDASALSTQIPLVDIGGGSRVLAGDRPVPAVPDMAVTDWVTVSPGFFEAAEIPILAGRAFDELDDARRGAPPVLAISRSLSLELWPHRPLQQVLGERVAFELDGTPADFEPVWREVVAVVGDVRYQGPRAEVANAVYVSHRQRPLWSRGASPVVALSARSERAPESLATSLRQAVRRVDPALALFDVRSMKERVGRHVAQSRMVSVLLAAYAGLATALTVVGLSGIVSYSVTASRRELGLRMALGARPAQVLGPLLRASAILLGVGAAGGLLLAVGLTRLMITRLHGVDPLSAGALLPPLILLLGVGSAATLLPSLRALRVDPTESLRLD